eukprot:14472844-Alexandrium_andersonii.AAC.1
MRQLRSLAAVPPTSTSTKLVVAKRTFITTMAGDHRFAGSRSFHDRAHGRHIGNRSDQLHGGPTLQPMLAGYFASRN